MKCGQCAYPMRDRNYWMCMAPMRVGDKNRQRAIEPKTECFNPTMFVAKVVKQQGEINESSE